MRCFTGPAVVLRKQWAYEFQVLQDEVRHLVLHMNPHIYKSYYSEYAVKILHIYHS